jgi:hypothetical protein
LIPIKAGKKNKTEADQGSHFEHEKSLVSSAFKEDNALTRRSIVFALMAASLYSGEHR